MLRPNIGYVHKRYLLQEPLGQGMMGVVFRAVDRLTNTDVALKQVNTDHLAFDNDDQIERNRLALAHEFKILASLQHPNIIKVLDYGFWDVQQPFISMTLLENPQSIVRAATPLTFPEKAALIVQVLEALVYLHRHRILHHDLKPSNVLVVNNTVKVLDFGLADILGTHHQSGGTLAYMAPEVISGDSASEASDLYAIGIMLFELFAGEHPFDLISVTKLIDQVSTASIDLAPLAAATVDYPDLVAIVQRLMAKRPEDRYHHADEVINALNKTFQLPTSGESIAIRESFLQSASFVGRSEELTCLIDALWNTIDAKGSSWLVGGESGIGKSRLIDELRIQALVEGVLVVRGQAVREASSSYFQWREVLRWLVLLGNLGPEEASVLKSVVPDIPALLSIDIPDAPELDPLQAQQRLMNVIVQLFRQQSQPILVLLEDLQWADSESLNLLRQIIPNIVALPVMLVGTYRQDEKPNLSEQLPGLNEIRLGRLSTKDLANLSASILGESGHMPALVEFLNRETEGNVFFAIEVIRVLAQQAGRLQYVGLATLPQSIFPDGIQTILNHHLERVSSEDRALLELAAVSGRHLDLEILKIAAGRASLETWLTTCIEAAIVEAVGDLWRFAHDKFREGLLMGLDKTQKQRLHYRIAEAIEQRYPNNPSYYAILAHHWENKLDKELHYLYLAAQVAFSQGAFDKVIELADKASQLIQEHPEYEAKLPSVLYLLAEAHTQSGGYETAQKYLNQILEDKIALQDKRLMVDVWRSTGATALRLGNTEKTQRALEESLSLARELADAASIALSLMWLGALEALQNRYDKASEYFGEALEKSRTTDNQNLIARVLNALGENSRMQRHYQESLLYYQEALDLYKSIGHQHAITGVPLNIAHAAAALGQHDLAIQNFCDVIKASIKVHDWMLAMDALGGLACVKAPDEQPDYTLQVLSFVKSHPSTLHQTKMILQPTLDKLQQALPPEVYRSALEIGTQLHLEDILNHFSCL